MARSPRAPKAPPVAEGAPAEPDLLDNAPAPREADAFFGHREERERLAEDFRTAPPQGLILQGPRGVGKATLAFRLAKAVLSGAALDHALTSDSEARDCRQISAGTHPALLHLTRPFDEKAKRFKTELSVDMVRRIVPFLGSSAAGDGWRFVIVDAVDDMNASAANALLKSLEEPPRRTVFVLVAHVAGRVLPTIRSRCRTVRLRPLSDAEVGEALRHYRVDAGLADVARGSVRRALTLATTGADAVRSAERLIATGLRNARDRFALADLAAQKRGEHFALVADLALDALAARARAPTTPSLAARDTFASLYLDTLEERRRVEIYNLDRKEFMLALGERLASADRANRAP